MGCVERNTSQRGRCFSRKKIKRIKDRTEKQVFKVEVAIWLIFPLLNPQEKSPVFSKYDRNKHVFFLRVFPIFLQRCWLVTKCLPVWQSGFLFVIFLGVKSQN